MLSSPEKLVSMRLVVRIKSPPLVVNSLNPSIFTKESLSDICSLSIEVGDEKPSNLASPLSLMSASGRCVNPERSNDARLVFLSKNNRSRFVTLFYVSRFRRFSLFSKCKSIAFVHLVEERDLALNRLGG